MHSYVFHHARCVGDNQAAWWVILRQIDRNHDLALDRREFRAYVVFRLACFGGSWGTSNRLLLCFQVRRVDASDILAAQEHAA